MTEVAAPPKDDAAQPAPAKVSLWDRIVAWVQNNASNTMVSAAVAAIVTGGMNFYWSDKLKRAEVELARETTRLEVVERSRREAVESFVREATSLNVLVPAFVSAVSRDNRIDQQARDRILENLLKQKTLLDDLTARLPPTSRPNVADYEKAVEAFHTAVLRVRAVDDGMSAFWTRASDLVAAREGVIEALRPIRG